MAKTKNKNRKKEKATSKVKKKATGLNLPDFLTNDKFFIVSSLVLAVIYYSFSFISTGFYAHDGASHYIGMRDFWQEPSKYMLHKSIGFYLFYAIPAQFGVAGTKIWGALVGATACFLTYKVTKNINKNVAFLAFILLATQHMWVNFTYRTHVEVATAFFFILAVFLHQEKKYFGSALAFSWLGVMRPELYVIGFGYFLWLFFGAKKYKEALLMGIFPLGFNIAGWAATGKPLYLLDFLTGGPAQGTWTKAGFDHYLNFFSEVYGGVTVALLVTFIGAWALSRKRNEKYWILFIPPAAYVFMQCLFNLEAIHIGPYTGGTVRYILLCAPLMAVMGALGASMVEKLAPKWKILFFILPLFLVTAFLLSFEMVWMVTDIRKWDSTIAIGLTSLLVMIPTTILSLKHKYFAYGALAIASAFYTIKPFVIDNELITMKQTAEWYEDTYLGKGQQLFTNHTMFWYFLGKSKEELDPTPGKIINDAQMQKAPKNSIIIWEPHYGYRPKKANFELQYTYFTERPEEYRLVKQITGPNKRFVALAFEKLK